MVVIDRLELDQATELEVVLIRLSSGQEVVAFGDCTNASTPYIYKDCFLRAVEWLAKREG